MAVAFDTSASGTTATKFGFGSATSITVAFTASGSDRWLGSIVQIGTGTTISSVAYDGEEMTGLHVAGSPGGSECQTSYVIAPATTSKNIVATFASSIIGAMRAMSFTGVDQTTPHADTDSGENDSAVSTISHTAMTGGNMNVSFGGAFNSSGSVPISWSPDAGTDNGSTQISTGNFTPPHASVWTGYDTGTTSAASADSGTSTVWVGGVALNEVSAGGANHKRYSMAVA